MDDNAIISINDNITYNGLTGNSMIGPESSSEIIGTTELVNYNSLVDQQYQREDRDIEQALEPIVTIQECILNGSRISPSGNGNASSIPFCTQPTSGQKWWAAVVLGFVFALVSSPVAYYMTSTVTTSLGGISLAEGPGPNFVGLLVHTIIFILIVRMILW